LLTVVYPVTFDKSIFIIHCDFTRYSVFCQYVFMKNFTNHQIIP
jgi:hypothetical protein